jgi:hypothetical protein
VTPNDTLYHKKTVIKLLTLSRTKFNGFMQGISWYHIACQAAYTSIASSTDDARGEATSTVPASQSTLRTRYLVIQQETARL